MTLRDVMRLAADRDLVARQYANGFPRVLGEALPRSESSLESGQALETAIVAAYLNVLAAASRFVDRPQGGNRPGAEVSRRAAEVLAAGWPDREEARRRCAKRSTTGSAIPAGAQPRHHGRPGHGRLVRGPARWDNSVTLASGLRPGRSRRSGLVLA